MQSQILDRAVLNHCCPLEVHLALSLSSHAAIDYLNVLVAELMLSASLRLCVFLLGLSVDLSELIEDLSLDVQEVHADVVST